MPISKSIQKTVQAVRKAKKILVVAHISPDGDTIGCLLALGLSFLQMGKKVTLLSQDGVPTRFQFLPGSELVLSESNEKSDVAIAVDCGGIGRIGRIRPTFLKAKTKIQIDHHDFGEPFGDIQVVEEEASAVGEIIYDLVRALRVEMTPAIATCLLVSIIVDTGAFRFSNLRPKTFDILSKLLKTGVNLQNLIEESYWQRSRAEAKLSGYSLSKSEFSKDGRVAWCFVTQKEFKQFGANIPDVDNVADDLRSIEGVKIAALFRETPKKTFRVSLRSSHGINVALVAKRFGGGGHHNSAGCFVRALESEKKKVIQALQELVS